jgi:tRNA (cmo5U34)-methyltransferase
MTAEVWKDGAVARQFLDARTTRVPGVRTQLEVLVHLLRSQARPPRRIVDLGAGDGLLLGTVLEAFPDAAGIAVDFSPPMLDRARERLRSFDGRAAVVEGDLGAPGWQVDLPPSFDAVISGFAIHHLPDARKRALYAEIHGCLAPGGLFLNLEHVASATPRVESIADEAMVLHQYAQRRAAGEAVGLEEVRRAYLTRPDRRANILASVETQCAWLRDLGFVDVDCFWKWFELALFGGLRAPCS